MKKLIIRVIIIGVLLSLIVFFMSIAELREAVNCGELSNMSPFSFMFENQGKHLCLFISELEFAVVAFIFSISSIFQRFHKEETKLSRILIDICTQKDKFKKVIFLVAGTILIGTFCNLFFGKPFGGLLFLILLVMFWIKSLAFQKNRNVPQEIENKD